MYNIIESKDGYEVVTNIERDEHGTIIRYKSIKFFVMREYEDYCNNLGKLKALAYIQKEEKLPYLDVTERIVKGKRK
jgi:hypothetical protein